MRLIDRWAGIPLCFVTGLWSWIKSAWKTKSYNHTKQNSPEIIVFIGLAEIGALVVAFPAIQEARKQYPNSRVCFITGPPGLQTLELMGFEKEEILLMSLSSLPGMFLDYDCVIIPGFGGFVCNERPAWYDDDKEEMVPPSRDVLFNPNLTHNDGLLAQEIIRSTGLSYSEAMKLAA